MILVLLGTNPYPFDRLLSAISEYCLHTGEKIIAQTGNTTPQAPIECHPFIAHSRLVELISEAEVVVCQGGYGSLIDCTSRSARTVGVPRRIEFGECADNQVDLIEAFADQGLIIPVYDIENLPDAIMRAKSMEIRPHEISDLPIHIAKAIRSMIEDPGR